MHCRATKTLFSFLWSWYPKIYWLSCCDGAFFITGYHCCIVSLLHFPELRFFLKKDFFSCCIAYICVGLQLNMALHLFLQHCGVFFSFCKHLLSVSSIPFTWTNHSSCLWQSCVVSRLMCASRVAWGILLDTFFEFGYYDYHFFTSILASILTASSRSQGIKFLLFSLYPLE